MEEREKFPCLLAYLNDRPQATGIVYCSTRKKVDEVYEKLTGQNIAAARYHAGMPPEERQRSQEAFLFDQVRVMVATNAFGMGIDKSNVNFVIHYNMPLDLESYYQEAGRAGRDGQDADCILLYSAGDVRTGNFLIDNSEPAAGASPEEVETQILRQKDRLRQMTFYCHSRYCLRGEILKYFGQRTGRDGCGACSVCHPELQRASVVKLAAKNAAKLKAFEEKDLNADHLQQLKDLRLKLARQAGVPAFVVFTDATLRAMCAHLPQTREQLLEVPGVGVRKCEQYGEEFLALLNTFEKE